MMMKSLGLPPSALFLVITDIILIYLIAIICSDLSIYSLNKGYNQAP
jgi:hypothetical protein